MNKTTVLVYYSLIGSYYKIKSKFFIKISSKNTIVNLKYILLYIYSDLN